MRWWLDLGSEGRRAVELLFDRARSAGVIAPLDHPLFLGDRVQA